MTDTIKINKDTPTDELMTVLEILLGHLIDRVGLGMTISTLFGTAVMLTVDDVNNHA